MKKLLSCLSLALLSANGYAQFQNELKVNQPLNNVSVNNLNTIFQTGSQTGVSSLFLDTEYCTPFSSGGYTYINSFTTSGGQQNITNVSTGFTSGGYADHTSTSVVETFPGGSFTFTSEIIGGTAGFSVWIDWNKDFSFSNSTEKVFGTSTYEAGPFIKQVLVPDNLALGDYRMRVTIDYNFSAPANACASTTAAEFEDFIVRVGEVPSCPNPSQLSASNVTGTTADLSWNSIGNETAWKIEYGQLGFAQGSGTIVSADSNPFTLTGLSGSTNYEFYVQADCGGGDTSVWTGPYAFKTDCTSYVPNYSYSFSGGQVTQDCWIMGSGGTVATGPTTVNSPTSIPWYPAGFLGQGTQGSVRYNFSYKNKSGWLITPTFDLSDGQYEFSFDYGLTKYGTSNPGNLGSDDEFKLLMSEDGGATWTEIQTWTAADNISNTSNHYVYTIPSNSSNVKFAFYGNDGAVDDPEDVNLYIDNVKVTEKNLATSEVAIKDLAGVQVYPNPFTDVLNINNVKGVQKITVSDISGRVIKTFEASNSLNLGQLESGLYLISLSYEDGSMKTIKAIKK